VDDDVGDDVGDDVSDDVGGALKWGADVRGCDGDDGE